MTNKISDLERDNKCAHEFVTYEQCCYCGAYNNGKEIVEKLVQANAEDLRQRFSEWYFGVKESNSEGKPPLAMQIFYWFDKNLGIFDTLTKTPEIWVIKQNDPFALIAEKDKRISDLEKEVARLTGDPRKQ